ncbi:MAG: HAMP domain-containing protein [Desulfovibrionaceae bacterium]|nr:HAMP domain-containing protein [Desulfovibrionaceae bacterium]
MDGFEQRSSIFRKILLISMAFFIPAVLVWTVVSVRMESGYAREALIFKSRHISELIASSVKSAFWSLNWIYVEEMLSEAGKFMPGELVYALVVKPDGEVYLSSDKTYQGRVLGHFPQPGELTVYDDYQLTLRDEKAILVVDPLFVAEDRWYVVLAVSTAPIAEQGLAILMRNLFVSGFLLSMSFVFAAVLSKVIAGPIVRLANAAGRVSGDNLELDADIRSSDEVGLLAHSFRRMLGNLRSAQDKLKNYSQDLEMQVNERTADLRRALADLRRFQSEMIQSEKLASLGQLAGGIAHEINTPAQFVGDNIKFLKNSFLDLIKLVLAYEARVKELEAAAGAAGSEEMEALRQKADLDFLLKEVPEAIEQSQEGMSRIGTIVHSMKQFAHPGSVEKVLADIHSCLDTTLTVCRNEWKYVAEIEKDYDPAMPLVPLFENEFNQVVLNIVVNAALAIKDKIGPDPKDKGLITVTTSHGPDWVEVRISDTGPGVPEEIREKIFDPFFTTREVGKGTGQGLAVAHSVVVKQHGGSIAVDSRPGRGATFIVRLPL